MEDVRDARRELHHVIRTLDEEIMQVFDSAFADVNEHFSTLVTSLFPGGTGRLSLTDPENLLDTGVEVEVRPAGRNVRRLSLLSGGERSLVALAFLFAVFRSRPSPFYLMDEVEAALDDVNLQRFLGLVHEFREEAQLIIVSHQKRTMEAADALYGVTMAPGGSSKVVSQKVRRSDGRTGPSTTLDGTSDDGAPDPRRWPARPTFGPSSAASTRSLSTVRDDAGAGDRRWRRRTHRASSRIDEMATPTAGPRHRPADRTSMPAPTAGSRRSARRGRRSRRGRPIAPARPPRRPDGDRRRARPVGGRTRRGHRPVMDPSWWPPPTRCVGLFVAVPVVLVAGGVAVGLRLRGRGKATSGRRGGQRRHRHRAGPERRRHPQPTLGAGAGRHPAVETTPAPTGPSHRRRAGPAEPERRAAVVPGPAGQGPRPAVRLPGCGPLQGKIDAATWDDLEEALIRADVGVGATDALLDGSADDGSRTERSRA